MRSVLAGLRQLVIPWGASQSQPRIVIGPDVPPELVAYYQAFDPDAIVYVGMQVRFDADDYWAAVLVDLPGAAKIYETLVVTGGTIRPTNTQYVDGTFFGAQPGDHDVTGEDVFVIARTGDVAISSGLAGSEIQLHSQVGPALETLVRITGELRVSTSARVGGVINWGASIPAISEYSRDSATYENFNVASFTPTANAPELTFRVPPSRRGKLTMFVRADADAVGERFLADVEIRQGTSSGTVLHLPSSADGGIEWYWSPDLPAFTNFYGYRPLEPLSPAADTTYWAQLQINTMSTNVDVGDQWLLYEPLL